MPRPTEVEPPIATPEAWQIDALLRQVGLDGEELKGMTAERAQEIIERHWAGG